MRHQLFQKIFTGSVACFLFFSARSQNANNTVQIIDRKNAAQLEIRNGLAGVVVPKEMAAGNVPGKFPGPIQAVIYSDGTYSDDSQNDLQSPTPATSMKVNILKNTPGECVVVITYTFNKVQFSYGKQTYKGGDAGQGFYRSTISLKKGSKSILIEEESDYDVSYTFGISKGLQPDKARYRGWNATAVENGYEPSGAVYGPEDKRKPLDATVDLHYDKIRIFPYLSLWDPSGGEINTGRYWQLFNSTAPAGANLFGFFQGASSRLIGAKHSGPRLVLNPSRGNAPNMQGLVNPAAIQMNIARRGPDNTWFPRKRFQWALFISTKADLLAPDQFQPIGKEMNRISGLATKIDDYAKKPADIMPAFFDGAIYMSAFEMQDLIKQVKTNAAFYSRLIAMDPYFKPVADAWRFPDSASQAIKTFIKAGEDLKNTFKDGDGVHAFSTQYWKGSFVFKKRAQEISALFADKSIAVSAAQKDALLGVVRMMARIQWDNDNVPFFDSSGVNFGPANMSYQYSNNGRNFFALLFAKDAEFARYAGDVLALTRSNILSAIYDNGSTFGTPHYTQATIDPILFTMLQLKQAGIANLFTEQKTRIYKFIDFYSALLTPPSVRFSGYRKLISFGDGSEESAVTFGLLASGLADSDPATSKKLYSIFQHGAPRLSQFGDIGLAVDLAKNELSAFYSGSANFPGYLSHFRSGLNTENESAVWIINGDKYFDHRNDDEGETAIYALKTPLSLSRSCFYSPRASDARIRSVVIPESEFPEWNKANQPIGSTTLYDAVWNSSSQLEFAKLKNSTESLSAMNVKDKTWYRKMMMVTIKEDQPVIIFYDSVNNNKLNIWSLLCMSQGAVTTPAGSITPINKTFNSNNPKLQELPEATPEKTMTGTLNKFGFTGQDWSTKQSPSGGINWDLYTTSGDQSSFTLSQWTNIWQNSQEASEFTQTNGKPYSETQQIIRIKSAAPFFQILLPYFKNSHPYDHAVEQAAPGKIRVHYGTGELLITTSSCFYSGSDKTVATTFSTQPMSEKGIIIQGGIAEVEISGVDVWVRIHGNSGKRMITLPFAVFMPGKHDETQLVANDKTSRITIDYQSKSPDLLSTDQGYKEYKFTKN